MSKAPQSISRRKFISVSSLSSVAFTLGFYYPASSRGLGKIINGFNADEKGIELTSWISIDKSGIVTLMNHRSEMGQGSFQSVPQIIAEELEVELEKVKIVFAPGHQKKYGSQVTGGSSTIRGSYETLLKTGATARTMLIAAAAKKWNVPATECTAEMGTVHHKVSGKSSGYGDLVEEAAKLEVPKDVVLKSRQQYKVVGKPLPRQDTPMKTNGTATFGLDKKIPGMLYAMVERNPRFKGRVKSFDDSETMKVAGVKKVFKVEMPVFGFTREGVAVVADSLWSAMQGRKALKVVWDDSGFEHLDTKTLYDRMKADLSKSMLVQKQAGDTAAELAKKTNVIEAVYETPYESHACMEPLNCIAHLQGDKCEIWGPIQAPDWIQSDVAERLKIPAENVTVNMTFLGGGFGRKAFTDYPYEAVLISKEMSAPVQVMWSREDDMTQGPFRPGAVYGCKAVLADDRISALQVVMAAQNMDHQSPTADKTKFNGSTIEGFAEPYFEAIPNFAFGDVPTESPIPVMWWRSVYSSTNGFAFESFIDELAHTAGKDPLAFRRGYLHTPRYKAVLDKIEEMTGWKTKQKKDGWGLAITECFQAIVAEAVKVKRNAAGKLVIDKIVAVMDCGWYVNPDIIKAQIEGSIVMALGAAVTHETHFADGKAIEKNFDTYRMPRITDIGAIDIYIIDNEEKAGGAGEPALPPFAPALCNAIFDLTGKRIRKLPFKMDAV
ncbi:MAG: molybdopterin cofactor-binding domain-containing protein [Bacteroidota bacterium]